MTAETTLTICLALLALIATNNSYETIRVYRHARSDKDLNRAEVCAITLFCVCTLGFGLLGYRHFHEKSWKDALKECCTFAFARNFWIAHTLFCLFFLATAPSVLWDCVQNWTFAALFYLVMFLFSALMAALAFFVQLPDFFYRHEIVIDEAAH